MFSSRRLPPAREAMDVVLREWLKERAQGFRTPASAVFCLDAPFDVEAMSRWQGIHDAMHGVGVLPAFGALPERTRPPAAMLRLTVGLCRA
jgi:hypothetical protein